MAVDGNYEFIGPVGSGSTAALAVAGAFDEATPEKSLREMDAEGVERS